MPEPPIVTVWTMEQHGVDEACHTWTKDGGTVHRADGPAIVATSLAERFAVLVWYHDGEVVQHIIRLIQERAAARDQLRQ